MAARVHGFGLRNRRGRLGVDSSSGLAIRRHGRHCAIGGRHQIMRRPIDGRCGLPFIAALAALAVTPAAAAAPLTGFTARGAVRAGAACIAAGIASDNRAVGCAGVGRVGLFLRVAASIRCAGGFGHACAVGHSNCVVPVTPTPATTAVAATARLAFAIGI